MSRLLPSVLLALALIPATGQAQLGGLKKKATGAAAAAAGVQTSTDQPARMAGPEVTPQSLDRLLAGLKAEAAQQERRAAEARRQQEQQDAARAADSVHQKCMDDFPKTDPGAKELERLTQQASAAADKGDMTTAMQLSQRIAPLAAGLPDRMKAACPEPAPAPAPAQGTAEQQAMQQGGGSPADAGANAAGMSATDYAQYKELVFVYLRSPNRAGLTNKEQEAINPKKAELQSRLQAVGLK